MGDRVSWLVEGRVALWEGSLSIHEVIESNQVFINQFLRAVPRDVIVHVIVTVPPGNLKFNLTQLRSATSCLREPNIGWLVVVTDEAMKRFFATVISQVARVRFRSFATFEEACQFLNNADKTLPDLRTTSAAK